MAVVRYRKGDRVRFTFGIAQVRGVVKEDRGPIGIKGRRLYRVEFRFSDPSAEPMQIELPAVDMEPDPDPADAAASR